MSIDAHQWTSSFILGESKVTDEQLSELVSSISIQNFKREFKHKAYFNKRLRSTGGRYMLRSHAIEINPLVLEKHGMNELIGVIKHELCHYHLHLEGKGYKHRDTDFRQLLKQTDSPRFCSTLVEPKKQNRTKLYVYECSKCGLLYRRKIRVNTRKFKCGKCFGELFLSSYKKMKEI